MADQLQMPGRLGPGWERCSISVYVSRELSVYITTNDADVFIRNGLRTAMLATRIMGPLDQLIVSSSTNEIPIIAGKGNGIGKDLTQRNILSEMMGTREVRL